MFDPEPNLKDYAAARREFSFDAALASLTLPPARGLNIGFEATDRQVLQFRGQQVALRWLSRQGLRVELTYGELALLSNRFANTLAGLGIHTRQVVCTLLGRVPALYTVALGTLKHRAVFAPLSPALDAERLARQLAASGARVLVTSRRLYQSRLEALRALMPELEHVLLVDDDAGAKVVPGTLAYAGLMRTAAAAYATEETSPSAPALLHWDSDADSAALPRIHAHDAVVLQQATGHYALDLHPGDVYFPALEPGTLLGTAYGIIAPLVNRATVVLDHADFSAERCYGVLTAERVNVFHATPEAMRTLTKAGHEPAQGRDLSALRLSACSGGPIEPEAVLSTSEVLGRPVHASLFEPNYAALVVANYVGLSVRPGSIGKPVPGIEAAILRTRDGKSEHVIEGEGELALKLHRHIGPGANADETQRSLGEGAGYWFRTGRRASCDAEGDFWLSAETPLN